MKLAELHKPPELKQLQNLAKTHIQTYKWFDKAIRVLAEYKFYKKSEGMYAHIFVHPTYPYVLKVFNAADEGYKIWFKFSKENQDNPFVPKIKGGLVKITDDAYACRLEELDPFVDNLNDISKIFWGVFLETDGFVNNVSYIIHKSFGQDIYVDAVLKNFMAFRKTYGMLDMHQDNIMLRGDQLVIIDPYG